jgi:hypothetical protein
MKNIRRNLLLTLLTLAMVGVLAAALPFLLTLPVSSSTANANMPGGSDLAADRTIPSSPSVWGTRAADGANIPGRDEKKVETSPAIESIVMLILGICLIVIAVLGKRIFQR